MKKVFFFLAAIVLTAACSGDALSPEKRASGETVMVDLSLEPVVQQTKSTADVDENRVNNVTLLVFDGGGNRLVYEKFNNNTAYNICLPGKKNIKIYAVVNSSYQFDNVLDYASFRTTLSQFQNNTMSNFEMVGFIDTALVTDCSLSMPVNRLASKLHIESIRINSNLKAPSTKSTLVYFSLKSVYIMNAASTYPYSLERSTTAQFISKDEDNPMIYHPMKSSYTWTSDGGYSYYTYNEAMDFYLYPNTSDYSASSLVLYIEVETLTSAIGGGYYSDTKKYQYNIRLPELRPNTMYNIRQLTIKNPGKDPSLSFPDNNLNMMAEYSIEVKGLSDGKVLESINKKEVAYAF